MNKILVIRIGRAGDMVMITPSLLALLDNYPDHELHVLTSSDGKRVLSGFNPRVNKLYVYEKNRPLTLFARLSQVNEIQKTGYEYIFNFELKSSYKKVYKDSEAKIFELDKNEPQHNYAKRCLNVVQKSLDNKIMKYWDWLPVTKEGVNKARVQLLDADISDSDFVIGIHPSFSGSKKGLFSDKSRNHKREWPPEHFSSVINMLAKYSDENCLNIKIIIDLLPDESALGKRIVNESNGRAILFTLEPDFQRYKALLERMNLLITPDTGPMHIAAAVGTKNVCLFSGKSPDDCGPYMPPEDYLALRSEDYDKDHLGLRAIKPEYVFEACKRFLPG